MLEDVAVHGLEDVEPAAEHIPLETPKETPKKTKRKHKKRASPLPEETDEPMHDDTTRPISPPLSPRPTSLEQLPALPSFPLPVHPAPPSKATLALQGLDRAILEAEIIDPSSSAPVPRSGQSDPLSLGLDDRMRDCLAELGVDSLFAGEYCLFEHSCPRWTVSLKLTDLSTKLYSPDSPASLLAQHPSSALSL